MKTTLYQTDRQTGVTVQFQRSGDIKAEIANAAKAEGITPQAARRRLAVGETLASASYFRRLQVGSARPACTCDECAR